jgi:hypothetical protein
LLGARAKSRVRKQSGGEAQPKGKAKAKAKAKAASGSCGDWAAWATSADGDPADNSETEFEALALVPYKKPRGSRFCFVPGKDEMGRDLPTDDVSAYSAKQKYVMDKIIEKDADKKQEYDDAVGTRSKDTLRAYVNSQVPKNATYAWAVVAGDDAKSTAEHTVLFQEQVWGVRLSIIILSIFS